VIARCSKRSCLVAAGAEPGTGNLSPRVDECKPLSMLFASSGRSLSLGTLPSWVLPLLRSPGEPWSGPFQMIVGRRCGCPRRRQRSLVCSSEPWLGMSGPGLRSVSCGNGPPECCFRCSLNFVGVQGMCRSWRDGRQAGRLGAKVQVSAGGRSSVSSIIRSIYVTPGSVAPGRIRTCAHSSGGESCS